MGDLTKQMEAGGLTVDEVIKGNEGEIVYATSGGRKYHLVKGSLEAVRYAGGYSNICGSRAYYVSRKKEKKMFKKLKNYIMNKDRFYIGYTIKFKKPKKTWKQKQKGKE